MKPEEKDRQALNALLKDAGRDMTDAEVDEMIDRELDKGERMDADLVAEALVGRETEDVKDAQARSEANWKAIEWKLHAMKRATRMRPMRWIPAAAALIAVGMILSMGIKTGAGRWEELVRIFQPFVTETLGIHLNARDPASDGKVEKEPETDSEGMTESVTIREERKAPGTVHGYAAMPAWLPEGFVFEYAQVFDDGFEASQMTAYKRADGVELFVQTIVYLDASTAVNVVEKDAKKVDLTKISVVENKGVISAIYENNLACTMVWGRLSQSDIMSVITSLIEGAG
jgi:hypothetical protein